MQTLLIFGAILIAVYLIGFSKRTDYTFMDKRHTTILRGISILTVLFCHLGKQLHIEGIQFIAGIGVSIFLIISGYGLCCSYQKHGLKYFWLKKLVHIILPYYLVSFAACFAIGTLTSIKAVEILLFQPLWYMWYLLIWYAIFYVFAKLHEKFRFSSKTMLILLIIAACVWFVIDSLFIAEVKTMELHARQMPSFVFGVALALYFDRIKQWFSSSAITKAVVLLCVAVLFLALTQIKAVEKLPGIVYNIFALPTVFVLAISTLILSSKFKALFRTHSHYALLTMLLIVVAAIIEYYIFKWIQKRLMPSAG